ncbi:fibronectin type III domain-containing protein [Streptomyces sp. NPDC005251]|uniref:fibronectin type III domain-containing protein n=1 Tax=Streptomyces sp. NPDC005251 TaxID=3157166 RepID=UPI0033A31DA5
MALALAILATAAQPPSLLLDTSHKAKRPTEALPAHPRTVPDRDNAVDVTTRTTRTIEPRPVKAGPAPAPRRDDAPHRGDVYVLTAGVLTRDASGAVRTPAVLAAPRKAGEPAHAAKVRAPGSVTDVRVSAEHSRAYVSWHLPADDAGAALTGTVISVYRVDGHRAVGHVDIPAGTTSATVAGLSDGVAYRMSVSVTDKSSYASSGVTSDTVTPRATTAPGAPASVTATPGNTKATVGWTSPTDNGGAPVTAFVVTTYNATTDAKVGSPVTVTALATSTSITGLVNGTTYYFGVAATNSAGTGPQLYSAHTAPAGPPGQPTNAQAYPSNGALLVTWTAPTANGGSPVTAYTLIASGPSGPAAQSTVNTTDGVINGLANNVAYTVTVTAANAATAGSPSAPSAAATPSAAYVAPANGVSQLPPNVTDPTSTLYGIAQLGAVVSGNGRYVFYSESNDPAFRTGINVGVVRFDTKTGTKTLVSVDGAGQVLAEGGFGIPVSSSYDGNVVAFTVDTNLGGNSSNVNVYVRNVSAATTTLVSRNDAGGPSVGVVPDRGVRVSGNGNAVFFQMYGNTDMAARTPAACGTTSTYRFDVASGALSYLDPKPAKPANIPQITGSTCFREYQANFSVSDDGGRVTLGGDLTVTCTVCDATGYLLQNQAVVLDVASGGTTKSIWYSALAYMTGSAGYVINGPGVYWPQLSGDGSSLVAITGYDELRGTADRVVRIGTGSLTSAPQSSAATPDWLTRLTTISGNGSVAVLTLSYNDASGLSRPLYFAMDIASGSMAVLNQVPSGALANGTGNVLPGSIDYAGDRVVFDTDAPNLLGQSTDSGERINVILQGISTLGVLPSAETRGCNCANSLAGTAPVQDFVGDPVNTATGAFTESVNDGGVPSPGASFAFQRTYDSSNATVGPLGRGWSMPYGMSVSTAANGAATVTAENGAQGVFHLMPDGTYRPDAGINSTLVHNSTGYTLTLPSLQTDLFSTGGQLTAIKDRNGQGLDFGYTGTQLTAVTDAAGGTSTLSYDATSGRLKKVTLPDVRSVSYGYDTSGLLSVVTAVDGTPTTYGYDSGHRLTTVTDPQHHVVTANTYDSTSGRVTKQVTNDGAHPANLTWDTAKQVATYTAATGGVTKDYYAGNVLLQHVDPDGSTTSYTYDAQLHVTSVTDPNGDTTRMTYDATGHLLSRTSPAPSGYSESWTYDGQGNMLTHIDARGYTTTSTYNAGNQLTKQVTPAGATTTFTYEPDGQLATVTAPGGGVTTDAHDAKGNLVSVTDPAGGRTTFTYDSSGRVLTETSPVGNASGANSADYTTTYTYGAQGRLATSTDALGHKTAYGYDDAGNLTSTTTPAGETTGYTYDAAGNALTVTDPTGAVTANTYDALGSLTSTTDALGDKTTYAYDPAGLLATTVSPRGNQSGANKADYTTSYAYDRDGRQTVVTDPLGYTTKAAYDEVGRVVSTTDPLGHVTKTVYDADGDVVTRTDPAGHDTTYAYDKDDRPSTTTDPSGGTTTIAYDPAGRMKSTTSPMGEITSWTYDAAGHRITQTDPRGHADGATAADFTTTYDYDSAGQLLKTTDPTGSATRYGYDAAGRRVKVTDPAGNDTVTAYDADGRAATVTDPLGHATHVTYVATGQLKSSTDPTGAATTYTYDTAGRLHTVVAPDGNVAGATAADFSTTYGYDADGNQTTATGPTGAVTTTSFDPDNRPVTVTDPMGFQRTTGYDAAGHVLTSTDAEGKVVTSSYNTLGLMATNKDALGRETTYGYDASGHLLTQTSPLGEKTSWSYDADGRTKSVTDPRGNAAGATPAAFTTTYAYDLAGNQVSVTDPLGHATATAYDADNRQASVTDAMGHITAYGYDPAGNLAKVTSPGGAVTGYAHDAAGNETGRTDANGHITQIGYDADNRLTSTTDPLGAHQSATFDASGNRVSATDARGITATYSYDHRGLLTGTTYSDSTPSVAYTYDANGRALTQKDGTGAHTLGYDKNGRLTSVSEPTGRSFTYTYDPTGSIKTRTAPDGLTSAYGYDDDGRQNAQTTAGATTGYGYDAAGNLTTTTLPAANGWTESRSYDGASELTGVSTAKTGSTLASFQLTLNADGQPASVAINRQGTTSAQHYTYDADSRLTSACAEATCPSGAASVAYTYDGVGNRLTRTAGATTTAYTYDAADELTRSATGMIRQVYTYDADGNQTGNGSSANSVAYDANNRPVSAVQGSHHYAFTYDAQGDRVTTRDAGSVVRTSVWDVNNPLPQVASEADGTGASLADYTYDPLGEVQSETTAAGTSYDTHDWLGSVTDVTSAAGAEQISNSYDSQGVRITQAAAGAPPNAFGYTGQYTDPYLTGLVDMHARQYNPATGTFTGRDPVTQATTDPYLSPYTYAADQPTTLTDPSGNSPQSPGGPDVASGHFLSGGGNRHNFAVDMAYEQLSARFGAAKVYADLGPTYYGPIGELLQLPGAGRNGGLGKPDLAVKDAPVDDGVGWWIYEVKPASQAGADGVVRGGIEYNGQNALDQLARYIRGMKLAYPGERVQPGEDIIPEAQYNTADRSVETIFSAGDWFTYGSHFQAPIQEDMKGLIFYTNFRPTKNKQKSQSYGQGLPGLELLRKASGSQLGMEEFVLQLAETGIVPTVTCNAGDGSGGDSSVWPWVGVGVGTAGYFGYQAWSNRLPSWLSDASIEQFLESEGVQVGDIGADITADVGVDLAEDASIAALRQALIDGAERLGLELVLAELE